MVFSREVCRRCAAPWTNLYLRDKTSKIRSKLDHSKTIQNTAQIDTETIQNTTDIRSKTIQNTAQIGSKTLR